jgi:hypothetical protein
MKRGFSFKDHGWLTALAALMVSDPALRHGAAARRLMRPPRLPRWVSHSGRSGPFNRQREEARRRRQIERGILKVSP